MDLKEQYDKIYRYCYFKINNREIAEDITQETFVRFFESDKYVNKGQGTRYLYTIARNLCIDEYRKQKTRQIHDDISQSYNDDNMINSISIKIALSELDEEDRELLLLRYANQEPVSVICKMYNMSRFAVYRRILKAEKELKSKLGKEDFL